MRHYSGSPHPSPPLTEEAELFRFERHNIPQEEATLARLHSTRERAPADPAPPPRQPLTGGYLVGRIQALDALRAPIPRATVDVQGRRVCSAADGRFKLPLRDLCHPLTLHISAEGYWRASATLPMGRDPSAPHLVMNFQLPAIHPEGDEAPQPPAPLRPTPPPPRPPSLAAPPWLPDPELSEEALVFIPPEALSAEPEALEWLLLERGVTQTTADILGLTPLRSGWLEAPPPLVGQGDEASLRRFISCFSERLDALLWGGDSGPW